MNKNNSGIYKITNLVNQKIYIGSAVNVRKRLNLHRSSLNLNKHDNVYLQRAWNKYGLGNFKFEMIEECPIDKLIEREQLYIDWFKPQYNIRIVAENNSGLVHTKEVKLKISLSKRGKKRPAHIGIIVSQTWKTRIVSEETKKKMSEAKKGKKFSEEHKRKIALAHLGKSKSRIKK